MSWIIPKAKPKPKANKYGAKKKEVDGHVFHSQGEAAMYETLKLLERAGEIKILSLQDKVYLTDAQILYKPDFKVFDTKASTEVWIEFKGKETAEWRIKRKLWLHYGPGILRVFKLKGMRMVMVDEIHPVNARVDKTTNKKRRIKMSDEQQKHNQEQLEAIQRIQGMQEQAQKLLIQIGEELKLLGEREMGNAK